MKILHTLLLLSICTLVFSQSAEDVNINNKAVALMDAERYREALPYLDQLVDRDSVSTIYRHNRAVTLFNLKRYSAALADYVKLSNAVPEESEYVFQIGNSYEQLDSSRLAIEYYTKAIKLENDKFLYFFKRGTVYLNNGKLKEAVNDFNESLFLNPKHDNSLHNRGIALFKLGQAQNACADWCMAADLGNTYSASHVKSNCSKFGPCNLKK